MAMRKFILSLAAGLLIGASVPEAAFSQTAPALQKNGQATPDPNEVVCEKQHVIGSRLAMHRICMTRAQWAQQRQIDRMDLEHIQAQRGCSDKC
jgi:hypothetical protein